MTQRSFVDVLQPDVRADLYRFYDDLRNNGPCFWDDAVQAWIVTDYELVSHATNDTRLSSLRYRDTSDTPANILPIAELLSEWMLYTDPPDHTRLRTLVSRTFTPKAVQDFRPIIEALVNELLNTVTSVGQMDFIEQFAYLLPLKLICGMFEIPTTDAEQLRQWSSEINLAVGNSTPSDVDAMTAVAGLNKMKSYLQEFLRRHEPLDDTSLLARFVSASADSDRLTESELMANIILFLLAGHATTTNLLGNGLLALLSHPDQLSKLRTRPDLIRSAIEEMLRFDSPVQVMLRRPLEPIVLGDEKLGIGDMVLLLNGAANRDSKVFEEPHQFQIDREEPRHISFGKGAHFCIGAALARLEAEVAFPQLLDRLPELKCRSETIEWKSSLAFRGLVKLDIEWTPQK